MFNLDKYKEEYEKVLDHYKKDIASIRTNRVSPVMLENIQADAYSTKMFLVQLAAINVRDSKTLMVEPWDKSILKNIEKAIQTASLGLSVVNEGNFLRVTIPFMTEETRNEILKILADKTEHARNALKVLRDKIKEMIVRQEKNKELSQDEKYRAIEDLDKKTREYQKKIQEIEGQKEQEIRI